MKKSLILILKGILIGMGKVIPGVSGSLIAVNLNLYEKAIEAISHFFQNIKENILFLGTLALGILIAIAFGSKALIYLLEFCYVPTMLLFVGFIAGVIPNLCSKSNVIHKKIVILSMLVVISLDLFSTNYNFYPKYNLTSYLMIIGIGFLDAATMIIPGISGTAIFMILGCYSFVLNLFGSLSNFHDMLSSLPYFVFFGIGILMGIVIVSRFMNYMLKNWKEVSYSFIIGFTISSVLILVKKVVTTHFMVIDIIVGALLALFGYYISLKLDHN